MKKIIMLLSIVSLAIFLAACGESSVEPAEEEGNDQQEQTQGEESDSQEESEETEEETNQTFTVGDTVQFDDLKITLLGVREVKDDLFQPENDKFIAVELEIENTSDESTSISTMMNMSLMTSDGYEQDQSLIDTKGNLDTELGAGRSVKGEIAFDAEQADSYEFIFEDPFTSGQAIWQFQASEVQ
ncbi:DUF4352 domain-containing protein [Tenuibacillus multivorans]|uniref:DUF4352 domain-containing protein n=1 Tax=Tenuibacillus multivorans TaxID=237069 RepID=A0A1H0ATH9_9BACI|nr:DUF4352 domain-containing protein [Tenuibacillus multivorans]GEL77830.1 hypothetical protein TMU01_20650 [Tenuibacillus multivorans]SDN36659.1 protein of unknown function [Tenuibacillus multivorans]